MRKSAMPPTAPEGVDIAERLGLVAVSQRDDYLAQPPGPAEPPDWSHLADVVASGVASHATQSLMSLRSVLALLDDDGANHAETATWRFVASHTPCNYWNPPEETSNEHEPSPTFRLPTPPAAAGEPAGTRQRAADAKTGPEELMDLVNGSDRVAAGLAAGHARCPQGALLRLIRTELPRAEVLLGIAHNPNSSTGMLCEVIERTRGAVHAGPSPLAPLVALAVTNRRNGPLGLFDDPVFRRLAKRADEVDAASLASRAGEDMAAGFTPVSSA